MGKVRDYHADGLWDPEGHPDVTTIFGTKTFYCFLDFHVFLPGGGPDGGGRWDSIFRSWWWQLSRRDDAILIRFAYSGKSEWHNESIVSLSRSLPPMIPGTNLHMPWGPLPTVRGARCMQNDHYAIKTMKRHLRAVARTNCDRRGMIRAG
ncbi:hypothetical protein MTP99_008990 [Tenebrio molitor]|nr:hypothetical protein MTP99_008990 [Tenebrio molitor]